MNILVAAELSRWIIDVGYYSFDLMHEFELLFMKIVNEAHLDSVRIVKSHHEPYKNFYRTTFAVHFDFPSNVEGVCV